MNKLVILVAFLFMIFEKSEAFEPIVMDSRIKTYIYNPNEVFPIILHYGYHSHIDFPKNEIVKNIIVGNPTDWDITNRENQLFLQTYSKNARTNMTIITTKRVYEFDLIAKPDLKEADYELAYAIKFYYPEDNIDLTGGIENSSCDNLDLSDIVKGRINTNYIFYGAKETTPIIAFNDARFTYLKFPPNVLPNIKIFTNTRNNKNKKLAHIHSYNGYVILDGIFKNIKFYDGPNCSMIVNKAVR